MILALALALALDTSAALETTGGWARAGRYVPVTLTITNRVDHALDAVRVDSGGPVRVVAPVRIEPAATRSVTVPVFYPGGDLELTVEGLAGGAVRATGRTGPVEVRRLPDDVALVAAPAMAVQPSEGERARLAEALDADEVRVMTLGREALGRLVRCGMVEAVVFPEKTDLPAGDYARVRRDENGKLTVRPSPYPPGTGEVVQPGAADLFDAPLWPAGHRRSLWLGLALVAGAALAAGALTVRRRAIVAAGALILVAAGATAVFAWFGGVRGARRIEARVFFVSEGPGPQAAERFVLLQARGGVVAEVEFPADGPLPVALVGGGTGLFETVGTLHVGDAVRFQSARPTALLHVYERSAPPGAGPAARDPRIASLRVEGALAKPAAGGDARPVGAWASAWKADADPARAFTGRSLAWWTDHRQLGEFPRLLLWVREPPSGRPTVLLRPALLVAEP